MRLACICTRGAAFTMAKKNKMKSMENDNDYDDDDQDFSDPEDFVDDISDEGQ